MPPITRFLGQHYFLSNFYPGEITWEGETYPTVEHAFQAAKTPDPQERKAIRQAVTPAAAKQLGRKVHLRPDWEQVKFDILFELLQQKFSQAELRQLLLDTGDAELIEGNTWGDRLWGCVLVDGQWVGQNQLGRQLMRLRAEIRQTPAP